VSLRLGFFGTAEFAVPSLRALHGAGHELALVVCQPDRPKGRGHHSQPPPLKIAAVDLGLKVWQPERMRDEEALRIFLAQPLDLACVVAYGQILPQAVLDAPRLGCVNLHASLLPRWRGAAPIEWALAAGDAQIGVSIQKMVFRLDAGDVLLAQSRTLGPEDDAPGLHAELALSGADLLARAVEGLAAGTLRGERQDEARVTLAPLLKKSDGFLDFSRERGDILRRFRAFKERPGVSTALEHGDTLKVLAMRDAGPGPGGAGRLLEIGEQGFRVACGDGSVWLERLRPPSGKSMAAVDYARGHALALGARFTAPLERL
jgi:methionyl-tRNA formyltransferase